MLPSNAPEGDATITLNYNNLTSNPIVIHVVRSAFGMFTVNQGGSGPAILQNFVSATQTPVNTLTTPATTGQTVILWGTGLGPVAGTREAVPCPAPCRTSTRSTLAASLQRCAMPGARDVAWPWTR